MVIWSLLSYPCSPVLPVALLFNTTGNALAQKLSTSACASRRPKDIEAVKNHLTQLSSSGSAIISSAGLFSSSLNTFHNQISQYGLTNRKIIFYVFYSVITALCFLLALGVGLRNKVLAQVSFFFAYWLALILSIISCVLMVPVVSPFQCDIVQSRAVLFIDTSLCNNF